MNSKHSLRAALIGIVVLASIGVFGQKPEHQKFRGVINAYTPQTGAVGPYEVRGPWSLTLEQEGKADFSAALTMQFSDGWVLTTGKANPDPFDPKNRSAHTHHITIVDGDVTPLANGFRVNGLATVTVNGGPPPVPISPTPLQIDITGNNMGGTNVEFSNITLTFMSPGSNHFGSSALPGVVRNFK